MHRRVPQILGMYVAATWMAVEMGDWLTERFGLPEAATSYAFVGLLVMAPSVILLAWGHGAPGRDAWTKLQGTVLGLNLILAAGAMYMLPPNGERVDTGPASTAAAPLIETRELTNELGETVTFEVAREGAHQRLVSFFWRNETGDEDLDWLSYGAPWLLTQDLHRSPLVSAGTPFDVAALIERLRSAGFDDAVGEPLSLDLQMAGERGIKSIITGTAGKTQGCGCDQRDAMVSGSNPSQTSTQAPAQSGATTAFSMP